MTKNKQQSKNMLRKNAFLVMFFPDSYLGEDPKITLDI